MSIEKPYKRIFRPKINEPDDAYYCTDLDIGKHRYVFDDSYAESPQSFVRAFLLIQEDLQKLFEYIEPSEQNLKVYSHRIHELLFRTCNEIEANFKAIFNFLFSLDLIRRFELSALAREQIPKNRTPKK